MTPGSNPGAGAPTPRPPAATPRAQGPVMSTYVNLGTAVRAAPTPQMKVQAAAAAGAPGIQAYPRAARAAVPTARPCMPLPHTQGAAAAAVLPRPMSRGNNLGGAPMPAAPSPMPRTQAARPGVPASTCPVGAAVPSAKHRMPVPMSMPMPPTQPAMAMANPAAPFTGKRPPTTMWTAIPPAKRHAPTQGAPTGGTPLPTNPAIVAAAAPAATWARHAQGAPGNATSQPAPAPKWRYFGVHHDPAKGWMARVMDPKRGGRDIGPFDDEHQAALAHDRVAIACAGRVGGPARINFATAFHDTETAFLRRWEGDICDAVEKGGYEESYAKYLKAGYKVALSIEAGDEGDDEPQIANCVDAELFWDVILDFFIDRPDEIGQNALREGGDVLMDRFVEMYRNRALCPSWRATHQQQLWHAMMIQKQQQQQQIQMQQQQQQIQTQQQQQQIQMQQRQQLHIQMQQQTPLQQQHIQMQQQMMVQKQQQHQRHIQMQQQQMMAQKQQQMDKIQHHQQHQQQQQQHLDGDAILQVKRELI